MRINESDFGGRLTDLVLYLVHTLQLNPIHHPRLVFVQQIMSDPTSVKHTFMESLVHEISTINMTVVSHLHF